MAPKDSQTNNRTAMRQIFVSLPQDKKDELQRLADETYSSLSQVARECLLRGLEQRLAAN